MTPEEMAKYLSGFSFRFNDEKELQYGIDQALQKCEEPSFLSTSFHDRPRRFLHDRDRNRDRSQD